MIDREPITAGAFAGIAILGRIHGLTSVPDRITISNAQDTHNELCGFIKYSIILFILQSLFEDFVNLFGYGQSLILLE